MRKYILIMLAVIVFFLVIAYVKLFTKQTAYHKTIASTSGSVLILENFDHAKVKIVTTKSDEIKVDLKGPAEDILSILRRESGIYTELEFSGEDSGVTGTISVPEGMLIDISLSEGKTVTIDDIGGKTSVVNENSFLVDTNNLNSLAVDDSGNVYMKSPGDLVVWDDEEWDPLDGNNGDGTEGPVYCGIGGQAIRDYCCELENTDKEAPECNGVGHWFFNNAARDCDFACEETAGGDSGTEEADCSVGGQIERNLCCSSQHAGEYMGCMGTWRYNAALHDCEFGCYGSDYTEEPEESGDEGGGGSSFSYGDPVSDYCANVTSDEEKSLCCNDILKNNLSTGPRPGFPDCIGNWVFDVANGCEFECAEHAEMIEILNELRQQAQ